MARGIIHKLSLKKKKGECQLEQKMRGFWENNNKLGKCENYHIRCTHNSTVNLIGNAEDK